MNLTELLSARVEPYVHDYTSIDTILYALGLGYGEVPTDASQLRYTYEEGLVAIPSLCVILAHAGFSLRRPEYDIALLKLLHAEQSFEIHQPLAAEGSVTGSYRVVAVEDRGDKGSVLYLEKRLHETVTGTLMATVTMTLFLRGDTGQGDHGTPPAPLPPLPDRSPDHIIEFQTLPQQALIYRLSGDWNAIHADPEAAARAGFDRPILHGLCTMGFAVRAILQTYCDDRPERLRCLAVRFTKPVFPGDRLRYEMFRDGGAIRLRGSVPARGVTVLDRCTATVR